MEEARGMWTRFSSLFRLTQIRRNMIWWTEAIVSCNLLSAAVTREPADSTTSPTCRQLMAGGGKPGEPGRYSPDTPRSVALEDL
jgi:hypothetical protein